MITTKVENLPQYRVKKLLDNRRKLMLACCKAKHENQHHQVLEVYADTVQREEGMSFILLYRDGHGDIDYERSEQIVINTWADIEQHTKTFDYYDYEIKNIKYAL